MELRSEILTEIAKDHDKSKHMEGGALVLILCDVLVVITMLCGTIANSIVLMVFYRRPGLRTVSNRFVMNLVLSNMVSCLLLCPLVLVDALLPAPHRALCAASEAVATATCAASLLAVLLIAVDQFCAVVDPLRYHALINRLRSAGMMVGSWTVSVVFGILGALDQPRGVGAASLWRSCDHSVVPPPLYRCSYTTVYALLVFALPFTSITWIYARIYRAAHTNSERARKTGSVDDYVPVSRSPSMRSTSSSLVSSLRCRLSNASGFRYREETRAARVSALVVVMALLCWLPYVLMLVLRAAAPTSQVVPRWADTVALTSLTSSALVSPLLFAFRSRRIQREVRRLVGVKSSKSSTNRQSAAPRLLTPAVMTSVLEVKDTEVDATSDKRSVLGSVLSRTRWGSNADSVLADMPTSDPRSSFSSGGSTQGTTSSDD